MSHSPKEEHPSMTAVNADAPHDWLASAPGQRLLAFERTCFARHLAGAFGYHALQLGLPAIDALAASPARHRWLALPDAASAGVAPPSRLALLAAPQALPFAAGSLDLIALPHTLELCGDAHAALREVQRTLAPEGKVAITGINPFSFWGWRHARARLWRRCGLHSAPWLAPDAALIAHWRLREWLQLLGFEVDALHLGCWLPALRREGTLARFAWLDALGSHCAPAFGAVYFILATRRVYDMRQLPAAWRRPVPAFGSAAAPSSAISGNAPQKASHD